MITCKNCGSNNVYQSTAATKIGGTIGALTQEWLMAMLVPSTALEAIDNIVDGILGF